MRRALFALLLAAGLVRADPAQYMTGDVLLAEVKRICDGGCIVFAPHEIEAIQRQVSEELARRTEAAFQAGRRHERETCRNAI